MNAISITGLVKSYGKVAALRGIDLTVPQGTIYGVVGPNGAGKTTLIKTLVGVVRPTSGTARVLELDPLNDKWALRKQIGYMPRTPRSIKRSAQETTSHFSAGRSLSKASTKK